MFYHQNMCLYSIILVIEIFQETNHLCQKKQITYLCSRCFQVFVSIAPQAHKLIGLRSSKSFQINDLQINVTWINAFLTLLDWMNLLEKTEHSKRITHREYVLHSTNKNACSTFSILCDFWCVRVGDPSNYGSIVALSSFVERINFCWCRNLVIYEINLVLGGESVLHPLAPGIIVVFVH